jgi:type IV pilus assembly protein PilX
MDIKNISHKRAGNALQKGVVLVMGLILLAVISLVAMYTLRSTLTGEQVSKNIRSHALAMQSAENALRICENSVRAGLTTLGTGANQVPFVVNSTPESLASGESPVNWRTRANWMSTSPRMATQIPVELIGNIEARPVPSPRCMVEQYELPFMGEDKTLTQPYLITAIGYSSDYQVDSNGNSISGSEIWLQSVLRP